MGLDARLPARGRPSGPGSSFPRAAAPRARSRRIRAMVRHEDRQSPWAGLSRCAHPAGGSPVPVGVGAPGSRPQAGGEIPLARAGCRKPLRREQPRGPQHQVKPAASKDSQPGGRAAHVTAKATSSVLVPKRAAGPGGVGGVARVEGCVRNVRGPSSLPSSRRAIPYKPKVKSGGAERESEGAIVPLIPVHQNAGGGKDPYLDHVEKGATYEGMAGHLFRSNSPRRSNLAVQVRYLSKRLGIDAKQPRRQRTPLDRGSRRDDDRGWRAVAVRTGCVMRFSERSLVSRVRENRTHGLKGGPVETRPHG